MISRTVSRSFLFLMLLLVVLAGGTSSAQQTNDQADSGGAGRGYLDSCVESFPDAPLDLSSPRETMRTFLQNMRAEKEGQSSRWCIAAQALDLTSVPSLIRERVARQAAFDLHEIINRTTYVRYEDITDSPAGEVYLPFPSDNSLIAMTRSEDGKWRFSEGTIDSLSDAFDLVKDRKVVEGTQSAELLESPNTWMRTHLPAWLFERTFILENFQWAALFVFLIIGFVADRFLRVFIRNVVNRVLEQRHLNVEKEALRGTARWSGLALAGFIWIIGIQWLTLPEQLVLVLWIALLLFTVTSMVFAGLCFVDFLAAIFQAKAALTESKFDDILIPLVRKSAKVFVVAVGVVFLADNIDVDITSLLAGLGIGGLAFALAAKDTVENVFGSIAILVDRPFQIGDWVKINDTEGTVEMVGLRSTRIRTFYNSLVTIPNSNLIRATVDNLGMRRYRRVKTMISVTYNTPPEKIDMFCEGIREIIRHHPYTRKDNFHVWLNEFGPSSLDILLYMFHETPDWATELRERHRLYLDIIRLAHRLGVEFAFPTQTLYLERGTGPAQPDAAPFQTRRDLMKQRGEARNHVSELVERMLREGDHDFIPPPVKFDIPMDAEELALEPRNRGGDAGS
jgi:MscS family membrane protein